MGWKPGVGYKSNTSISDYFALHRSRLTRGKGESLRGPKSGKRVTLILLVTHSRLLAFGEQTNRSGRGSGDSWLAALRR